MVLGAQRMSETTTHQQILQTLSTSRSRSAASRRSSIHRAPLARQGMETPRGLWGARPEILTADTCSYERYCPRRGTASKNSPEASLTAPLIGR